MGVLAGASVVALLVERAGVPVVRTFRFKGDLKRESQFLAQYGQGTCTFIIAWLVFLLDDRRFRWGLWPSIMVMVGTYGTGFLVGCLKRLLGRVRPGREGEGRFLGPHLRHASWRESFPSLHAACAVALSVILAHLYPGAAWVFWSLAGICAALRYLLEAHWPSDVLAGVAMGYGLGNWAWAFWGPG